MFDIGWGEMMVIGVVALVAIGPKELPGVLRMVGQWVNKARRMAGEFRSQFDEAMREAEMADLKKSFDDVADAARGLTPMGIASSSILGDVKSDVENALRIDPPVTPTPPEPPQPETFVEAETHQAQTVDTTPAPPVVPEDAPAGGKAS